MKRSTSPIAARIAADMKTIKELEEELALRSRRLQNNRALIRHAEREPSK